MYISDEYVEERKRISFTRFRLSSHNLKIELGRWSRIPRENRLCACGEIQDELHVAIKCPKTDELREKYEDSFNVSTMNELMSKQYVVEFIHDCIKLYE